MIMPKIQFLFSTKSQRGGPEVRHLSLTPQTTTVIGLFRDLPSSVFLLTRPNRCHPYSTLKKGPKVLPAHPVYLTSSLCQFLPVRSHRPALEPPMAPHMLVQDVTLNFKQGPKTRRWYKSSVIKFPTTA